MKRTVSSFKPLGAKSCSMSLDQPNSYLEALSAAASASALRTITVLSWSVMQFLRRGYPASRPQAHPGRSEEHTSELQSLLRISYAVFCLKKKNRQKNMYRH